MHDVQLGKFKIGQIWLDRKGTRWRVIGFDLRSPDCKLPWPVRVMKLGCYRPMAECDLMRDEQGFALNPDCPLPIDLVSLEKMEPQNTMPKYGCKGSREIYPGLFITEYKGSPPLPKILFGSDDDRKE